MKIKKLENIHEHNPFMDICFLECVVMPTGEVISGSLGTIGFAGENNDKQKDLLSHLYVVDSEEKFND